MRTVIRTLAALTLTFSSAALAQTGAHDQAAKAYTVEVSPPIKVKRGVQASARVAVVPVSSAHVSPDAPISLKLSSGKAVELGKAKLGRGDAKETAQKGVEFQVPFTGKEPGHDEIKGTLSFFICTAQICEQQKRDVTLAVVVE